MEIVKELRSNLIELGHDPDEFLPVKSDAPFITRLGAIMHDTCNTANRTARGFEGHTKRSLTRMCGRQGASRLVLRGPIHVREAQVFGGRGDSFVDVRPRRHRDSDRGGENMIWWV